MAGISLSTNLAAGRTIRRLGQTTQQLRESFERLSSGLRINRSSDDAAGLAIASKLNVDSRVYAQGVRNLNDGLSVASIAESTLNDLSTIVLRLRELAEQSANGTLGAKQRAALDAEAQALSKEYFRISRTTNFNRLNLFDGSTQSIRMQGGYGTEGGISSGFGGALGTGTFDSAAVSGANSAYLSLEAGDLNGDGFQDIAAASYNGNTAVWLGAGDGTFRAGRSYVMTTSSTIDVKLEDLNGDGILDLATVGVNGSTANVTLRLGNGDGTFKGASSYSVSMTAVTELTFADLNGDGISDMLVSGQSLGGATSKTGQLTVRLGTGNGTFGAAVTYRTTTQMSGLSTSIGLGVGDLNGDGKLDVVASPYYMGDDTTVLLGNGDGSFRTGSTFVLFEQPGATALGDVDGDKILDLIATGYDTGPGGSIRVMKGRGDGSFAAATSFLVSETSLFVILGDVNGDAVLDLITTCDYYADERTLGVRLGNGNGTFGAISVEEASPSGYVPCDAALTDINSDGVVDIVAAVDYHPALYTLTNKTRTGISPLLPFSLATRAGALQAMPMLKQAEQRLSSQLGIVGAVQSRLSTAVANLQVAKENFDSSSSRITDVDVAAESAGLVRHQILQSAGAAVLAQANQLPALALQLLGR